MTEEIAYARAAALAARALARRASTVRDPATRRAMQDLAEIVRARPVYHMVSVAVAAAETASWTIMHPLWGCGRDLISCEIAKQTHLQMPRLAVEGIRTDTPITGLHRVVLTPEGVVRLVRICACRPDQACAHLLNPTPAEELR